MGETTIARLFTPTERSKVDSPKKDEQMKAGAECRVPVCRLLNHVVASVVAAIFLFFFILFLQSILTPQMANLCKKKYDEARVCNNRCDK